MKRVLIQSGIDACMRVSMPGYDVDSADIEQTCFDSRWSGFARYLQGSVDSANDVAATVSFGETLAAPPLFVGYHDPGIVLTPGAQLQSPWMFRGGGSDEWGYVSVSTTSMVFRFKFGSQTSRLYYSLFRRIAG